MPVLNKLLDQHGHAYVDLILNQPLIRRQALQTAGGVVPPPVNAIGMVDTGATVSVIDPQLRQVLGLVPHRIRRARLPNSPVPTRVRSYKLELGIYDPAGAFHLLCPMLSVVEMPLAHTGPQVLVGCDVLERCLFVYDGPARSFTLSY
jgi:hypothetical protein